MIVSIFPTGVLFLFLWELHHRAFACLFSHLFDSVCWTGLGCALKIRIHQALKVLRLGPYRNCKTPWPCQAEYLHIVRFQLANVSTFWKVRLFRTFDQTLILDNHTVLSVVCHNFTSNILFGQTSLLVLANHTFWCCYENDVIITSFVSIYSKLVLNVGAHFICVQHRPFPLYYVASTLHWHSWLGRRIWHDVLCWQSRHPRAMWRCEAFVVTHCACPFVQNFLPHTLCCFMFCKRVRNCVDPVSWCVPTQCKVDLKVFLP